MVIIMQDDTENIYCNGDENIDLSHPKVYLTIDSTTQKAICPYCNKQFIKE